MSSDDSGSDMETPPPKQNESKKKKRLQDYLDEKVIRDATERAEDALRKRRKRGLTEDQEEAEEVSYPVINPINLIKNKEIRARKFKRLQGSKKKEEKLARKARKLEDGPKSKGHTIESLREQDQTSIANIAEDDHEEVAKDLEIDEFNDYYKKSYEPKVLITYSATPHSRTRKFGTELEKIVPNSVVHARNKAKLKNVCQSAIREEFTDIVVINENNKKPEGLLVIHLPEGPTAHFKLSNFKSLKDLKKRPTNITTHRPEVILTNFSTRLGLTIGRMLGALFHYEPEFQGRRVATFHNQRDYIFFRHHIYEFDKNGKRVKLRELGPRFTLKLRSLQQGLFDSKCGDYEWMITNKRHMMEGRRRFFL
ncbi:probable ribosome production factor 1 [Toxorhynchites rutilus septentrionalis]|uniref:probable ribosome production factor 1 n=1 Tax=Toxorhynchites rutilus septentrionalis TaxID=329112 RepID=UPI00247B13D8|nr:probable ribosome production factor 1 [Toxorhynchites rutilus septentrionalis]